jgi:hypothetical protein
MTILQPPIGIFKGEPNSPALLKRLVDTEKRTNEAFSPTYESTRREVIYDSHLVTAGKEVPIMDDPTVVCAHIEWVRSCHMRAYSMDLSERVLRAVNPAGTPRTQIAHTLRVSLVTIGSSYARLCREAL